MKVVILAGGLGTRLSEKTDEIPKPMVEIGGYPILWHIMNIYSSYGFNDFIIALGYKGYKVKDYFTNYHDRHADLSVDLKTGVVEVFPKNTLNWRITLVDTGAESMTGGRIKRLAPYLDDTFMLTYGDGVSNVNLKELLEYHKKHRKLLTMTTVHPTSRYGKLEIDANNQVNSFVEKPEFGGDWINGGFMVVEPEVLQYIKGDDDVFEREPLEKIATNGELMAFKHTEFWHCMDTLRDRNDLEKLWQSGRAPWTKLHD